MARLKRITAFKRPVTIDYPSADRAGEFDKLKVVAEYRYLDRNAITGLPKKIGRDDDQHLLDHVLIAVHDLEEEDGTPYLPALAAEVCKSDPWLCGALVKDWTNAVTGEKAKN